MFERFSQFNSTVSRTHGGLGIGLFVVQRLVELHKGTVKVESEGLGKGTAFTVELPIAEQVIDDAEAPLFLNKDPNTQYLAGKAVLVVDDEVDSRDFIAYALRYAGAEVQVAASAIEARALLESTHFDVLVSDVGMPGEDGYMLIEKVRKSGSTIPALAVTAFARQEDAARARSAGFQQHLSKPVDPGKLSAAVALLAKKRPTAQAEI